MRNNKKKAFLSCAVVAAIGLLAAPEAMATGSCTSFVPTITILEGPCPVDSSNPLTCLTSGPYTGIKYKITGSPDHVATVVTANNTVLVPSGFQAYAACAGDPVTFLGKYSCHEKAVKVNPNAAAAGEFWLVVTGAKTPILQSMVAKKGFCIQPFAVVGLGLNLPPVAPVTETLTDGDCSSLAGCCAVEFTLNGIGGEVLSAKLVPPSAPGCSLDVKPASALELILDGESLGPGNFGNGYFHSGDTSCTVKTVGDKVYRYGNPCPP